MGALQFMQSRTCIPSLTFPTSILGHLFVTICVTQSTTNSNFCETHAQIWKAQTKWLKLEKISQCCFNDIDLTLLTRCATMKTHTRTKPSLNLALCGFTNFFCPFQLASLPFAFALLRLLRCRSHRALTAAARNS